MGIVEYIGAANPHSEEVTVGGYQNFIINATPGEVLTLPDAVCSYLVGVEPNWWEPAQGWSPPPAGPQTGLVAKVYAAYTMTNQNGRIFGDPTSGGSFAVTLVDATTLTGWSVTIKNIGSANTLTVTPAAGQTIDGKSSVVLNSEETITIYTDGSGPTWRSTSTPAAAQLPSSVEIASSQVKTGAYNVAQSDSELLADTSGGAFAFTLPTATGSGTRKKVGIAPAAGVLDTPNLLSILTQSTDTISDFNLPAPVQAAAVVGTGGAFGAGTVYGTVTAINDVGETIASNEVSAVVPSGLLSAPTISSVTSATSGGALTDNATYNYIATYVNAAGETVGSVMVPVTTGNSGSNINTNTITLAQSPTAAGATSARIYRQQTNGLLSVLAGTITGSNTTLSDTTGWSSTNVATPPDINTTGGEVTWSWGAVPYARYYRFRRGSASGGETSAYDVYGTSFVDQNATPLAIQLPAPAVNATLLTVGTPFSGAPFSDVELVDAEANLWRLI